VPRSTVAATLLPDGNEDTALRVELFEHAKAAEETTRPLPRLKERPRNRGPEQPRKEKSP
jgi:hypothetical protein